MGGFEHRETITRGFTAPSGPATLLPGGGALVRVQDALRDVATELTLGATITRSGSQQASVTPQELLRLGSLSGEVPRALLDAVRDAALAGDSGSVTAFLDGTVSQILSVPLAAVRIGGQDLVFATMRAVPEITAYRLDAAGHATALAETGTAGDPFGTGIAAMNALHVGTQDYLFTASQTGDGLTGYRIGGNGALTRVESYGTDESLPIDAVTALDGVTLDGTGWLVAAAAGSSSLTVLRAAANGRLTVTDHVIDDLGTRFAGAAALEVVAAGDRAFVLAAGQDDGLSLFSLLPNGRLLHLDSLEDAAGLALDGVSGLSAQVVGDRLEILTTAAGEAGLSRFSLDMSKMSAPVTQASGLLAGTGGDDLLMLEGAGTLRGGAGDDILVDGTGAGQMQGGAGSDVFVMRADGARDSILDFDIRADRLDLSAWDRVYDASALQVGSGSGGALVLRHGDEVLELRPASGTLRAAELAKIAITGLSRADVVRAPQVVSAPAPLPKPAPSPPPGPEPGRVLRGGGGGRRQPVGRRRAGFPRRRGRGGYPGRRRGGRFPARPRRRRPALRRARTRQHRRRRRQRPGHGRRGARPAWRRRRQ